MNEIQKLFSEQNLFCQQTDSLILLMKQENNDPLVRKRLDLLKKCLENSIKNSGRVYIFGSRIYGTAKDDSDVDLYFDIGDCFSGKIADDYARQLQLINLLAEAADKEIIRLKVFTGTRIPIIRFLHEPTKFKCDLNFRSGLCVLNSELIKFYLSIDERVHWVVVAVKYWATTFNLITDDFSSYSLIWLVLFVMMHYKIVPPIIHLWEVHKNHEPKYTEGWDTRICFNNNQHEALIFSKSNHTKWELLRLFFKFFSNSDILQNCVLSTILGELLQKNTFYSTFIIKANIIDSYRPQIEKFEKCKILISNNFGNFNRIELQNPLKLCNNVIPWLYDKNMKLFIDLCTQSANSF